MSNIETNLKYVLRKLQNPAYKHVEIVRQTGIGKATLSDLKNGKNTDPSSSTVEKLVEYFREVDK